MPLILNWSKKWVSTRNPCTEAVPSQGGNPAVAGTDNLTSATFKITDTELYVPVVTLSAENDNNHLEQLKTVFNRIIKWNKYRSEMSIQAKNNNLNYLKYLTLTKVNRLFMLSYENEEDRTSFSKFYTPSIEIKDFSGLIDQKSFFDTPIKIEMRHMNKLLK